MEKTETSRKGWMIFFLAIYLGLFILATLKDLAISEYAVDHAQSWYTSSGNIIGSVTPTCVAGLGCAGLYQAEAEEKHRMRWFWGLAFVILGFVTGWLAFHLAGTVVMIIGTIGTGIAYFFLFRWLASKMTGAAAERKRVCSAIVLDVILAMVIVNILKLIWARERYIYMDDPAQEFTPWYIINGPALVSDAFKSFPSAHTVSAGTLLALLWLPRVYDSLKTKKKTIMVTAWLIIIYVAASRIFAGMHFLSDTLAGAGVAVLACLLTARLCLHDQKKPAESETERRN
jgi:membrane-associated phospholipid phosphatase